MPISDDEALSLIDQLVIEPPRATHRAADLAQRLTRINDPAKKLAADPTSPLLALFFIAALTIDGLLYGLP